MSMCQDICSALYNLSHTASCCHGLTHAHVETLHKEALALTEGPRAGSHFREQALQNATADAKKGPTVVFWHLEKAGGTAVLAALHQSLPSGKLQVVRENEMFSEKQLHDPAFFRIGLIREPCSYYASEYFWGRAGRGFFARMLNSTRYGLKDLYTGSINRSFAEWVRIINGGNKTQRCGLLSTRLWAQVLAPRVATAINSKRPGCDAPGSPWEKTLRMSRGQGCPCPLADCQFSMSSNDHERCVADIEKHDALQNFDCWLRTEQLGDDFDTCLYRYAARGGVPKHVTSRPTNANFHPSCASLFDESSNLDLQRAVYDAEGQLAQRFGWTSGRCRPHSSTKMPLTHSG